MMLVAAVWEFALRFVCTPTGIKPNTAIKQKAATPNASVTSTNEKPACLSSRGFMAGRREPRHSLEQAVLLHDFPRLD
jgi:hypothetical protein